mgnify:CR=1 FL=1
MTEEYPLRPKSDYEQHKISEEEGLLEEFDEDYDPQYFLSPRSEDGDEGMQVDLGFFQYQESITDYLGREQT